MVLSTIVLMMALQSSTDILSLDSSKQLLQPHGLALNSIWANKYRGVCALQCQGLYCTGLIDTHLQATVEDLDPPPALSSKPTDLISYALMSAYERDYTHLTVVSDDTRALLGYLNIPRLKQLLSSGAVKENEPVQNAMQRFRRKGKVYRVITTETPLEELEDFFDRGVNGSGPQDFAVVTDIGRKFVLGVATKGDLEEFVKRRPL